MKIDLYIKTTCILRPIFIVLHIWCLILIFDVARLISYVSSLHTQTRPNQAGFPHMYCMTTASVCVSCLFCAIFDSLQIYTNKSIKWMPWTPDLLFYNADTDDKLCRFRCTLTAGEHLSVRDGVGRTWTGASMKTTGNLQGTLPTMQFDKMKLESFEASEKLELRHWEAPNRVSYRDHNFLSDKSIYGFMLTPLTSS